MADPGWYKDRSDPALARWFDGERWTEHTLVRADQPEGVLPPPPAGWVPPAPEPEPWTPPAWSPPAYTPPPAPEPEPEPEPTIVTSLVAPAPAAAEPPAETAAVPVGEPDVEPVAAVAAVDAEVDPALQLDLFGGAPRRLVPAEPAPPDDRPAAAGGEPSVAPAPAGPGPEPGPASHLEELAPQGTSHPVGSAAFEAPTFVGPPRNRVLALPLWVRIVVPVVAVLLVVAAVLVVSGGGGGGDDDAAVPLDEAVAIARDRIDHPIPDAKVESLIGQLCGAAESGTSVAAVIVAKQLPVADRAELRATLDGAGAGARQRCPDVEVAWDGLLDDVYAQAAPSFPG